MRTDNEIKNYWNSYLKKQLEIKGAHPLSPKPISTTSSSSNSEAITTTKPNTTQVSEHPACQTQQSSSKSDSSSTQLINKVARKIVGTGYLDAVKSLQHIAGNSSDNDTTTTIKTIPTTWNNNSNDNTVVPETEIMQSPVPNFISISSHSSTSAQLLNKMATSLSRKVHGHEAARAVFSKLMESGGKGEASEGSVSGSDQVGGCLPALNLFEDGPHTTKTIGSPSCPRLIFDQVTTPLCFSDNEDNWLCVSSNYISFGNCPASGGDSSGSSCIESTNYSQLCFLDDNAALADESADYLNEILTCEDEINKYIQYL